MFNAIAAARKVEAAGLLYSSFVPLAEVELAPLPEGVTVVLADPRACGCRSDECYFCGALDDAVWAAAWQEELAEYEERWGHTHYED